MVMKQSTDYRDHFQSLKGVAGDLPQANPITIEGFPYQLIPVNCHESQIDDAVVELLTHARNLNLDAFLTRFNATNERTRNWLINTIGPDSTRILFLLKHSETKETYGYMGLAYGDKEGNYIEADAIVRTSDKQVKGLMRASLVSLINWVTDQLKVKQVWVRVLSDNPALKFYKECGFSEIKRAALFQIRDENNHLTALSETPNQTDPPRSSSTLVYMKYMKNDPIAAFKQEKAESISQYPMDTEWSDLSQKWMSKAFQQRYMYHFEWLGRPIIQTPIDMAAMQELIWQVKPDLIIETGIAHGGSLIMSASMLALLDMCDAIESGTTIDPAKSQRKVLGIDIDIRSHNRAAIEAHPMASRIQMIQGSSIAPEIIDQVRELAKGYKRILVCLDSNHTHDHVLAELNAYAPLTSVGSYCVTFDTIVEDMPADTFPDRPWSPGDNPKTAVWEYLKSHPEFEIDRSIQDKLLLTVAPDGYLKKVK